MRKELFLRQMVEFESAVIFLSFAYLVRSAFGLTCCFFRGKRRLLPIVFPLYLKKGKKQVFFVAVFKRDFIYLCGKIRKRSLRGVSIGVFL